VLLILTDFGANSSIEIFTYANNQVIREKAECQGFIQKKCKLSRRLCLDKRKTTSTV